MEALYIQPWEKDGAVMERDLEEQRLEALSPVGSATDEDEDSEPEPPPVPRRKVSFADAFGLNLVSVKEFDNADGTESYENPPAGGEASQSQEEFSMSCLFTVPSSPEELDQKLREQTVELESIELLPGTAVVRGNIRVVNLCYTKLVHVRMSLDRWVTHFDLLADYVPGSSDLTTDRFAFTYTLIPQLEAEGTRLELCLRYETPLGTFWANNKGMNYVLFIYRKAPVNGPQVQEEGKSKRSCLRASRRPSAEGKAAEPSTTPTGFAEVARKAEKGREAAEKAKLQFLSYQKSLVETVNSRRRETRLARVQDFMSQQRHRFPMVRSQEVDRPLPNMWNGGIRGKGQTSPQVLTYHEIPLLTLDWNNAKTCTWGSEQADDLWSERTNTSGEASVDSRGGTPCRDTRGNFPNVTGKSSDTKASVCDVWQAFLNGSTYGEHSGVLESEWLQTATSLSPSHNPKTPNKHSCQLPGLVLNRQPEGTCVSSPEDDRSETKFQTDTWQEFGLKGAEHVSKGPADRSDESHKIMHEQAAGGRIERMGEESCTPLTADLEPSSGGSESTEMPEFKTTRITDKTSRKDESPFSRPMVSRVEEVCPIRGDSLQQTQILASTVKSEGSAKESAASDNMEQLTGAVVEMDDGPSQEKGRLAGEGLEIIQPSGERQQHGGEALQLHKGGCNMVLEATQKEEEDSQTGTEGRGPTSDGMAKDQQEVKSVVQGRQTVASRGMQKVPQDDGETIGLLPNPNPADVEGRRWLLSQDNMESKEDISDNSSPKEIYSLRQPETSGRVEDGEKLRAGVTELKIEEQGELRGKAGVPRGEDKNRLTHLEEGELSAEAERSLSAEYEGAKDTVALNVMESESKKAAIEKFGEDLFRAIWDEVFKTSRNDLRVDGKVDDLDNLPTATQAARQKGLTSGGFSLTELHPRPSRHLERSRPQELTSTQQLCSPAESQTGLDPRARLCRDLVLTAAEDGRSPTDSSERSTTKQESRPQVRGEQEVACTGSFSPSEAPPSEKLTQSDSLAWWGVFYLLSHVTRPSVFSGFAVGLLFYFFLCDFPAFFALYMFSLCCWFYKWKRGEAANTEEVLGWPDPCVKTGEML